MNHVYFWDKKMNLRIKEPLTIPLEIILSKVKIKKKRKLGLFLNHTVEGSIFKRKRMPLVVKKNIVEQ